MNQKIIWAVTALVVVLMLAGAYIYAQNRATDIPAAITGEAAGEEGAITRVPQPSATPKPQAATPAPVNPQIYDEVKVDLSRIAGKLQMSSPHITATITGELPRYPLDLTCYRRNESPAISWRNAPAATKSYMLVLERRAPGDNAAWSWIIYNIPATTSVLSSNITTENIGANGVFGMNHYGHKAYTGPCEPKGTYPYILRLFALDTMLDVKAGATLQDLLPLINGHIIDAAEIRALHYLQM